MPLSSHTARVSAGGGTLSVSQPKGGKEHCGPVPTDTLDATAADRASGLDSTSQELGLEAPVTALSVRPPDRRVLSHGTLWKDSTTIMTDQRPDVFGGVGTHTDTRHAAVVDHLGRYLADAQFPTTNHGYRALLDWLRSHGTVRAIGVEGTGSYGTQLTRYWPPPV